MKCHANLILTVMLLLTSVSAAADVCDMANSTVAKATGGAAAATATTGAALSTIGAAAVVHSSGATILTIGGTYITGTLGTIGATTLGVLTAPATIAVATTTALAIGGTLAYCHYYASPETVKVVPAVKATKAPQQKSPVTK